MTHRALAIDAAFKAGDLSALRAALDDPGALPNGPMPQSIGPCLTYAVYHSPLSFIRELLELGADPNVDAGDGFPPLFAALWQSTRTDTNDLARLLLAYGADPNQRGHNDYSVLHVAVLEENLEVAGMLLEAGADLGIRTRIDDLETPRELAERRGASRCLALFDHWTTRHPSEGNSR